MPMKRSPESPRSTDQLNISTIRKVIREQTNMHLKSKVGASISRPMVTSYNNSDESESDVEVPVRRFTPLPDIPRADNPYYRTEGKLIKHELETDDFERPTGALPLKNLNNGNKIKAQDEDLLTARNAKKETRMNHFAQKQKAQIHRLPALDKNLSYCLHETMDLDEDLPMNPVHSTNIRNQRMTHTSPGDRIISPIKRPQAPSPPVSSINRRREDSDSEFDESL